MYVGFRWSQLIAKRHSSVYSKCRSCSCGSARKALPQHGVEFYSTITPIHGRSLHPKILFIPMVRSRHDLFFGRLVPQQHTWRIQSDARHEETRHSQQKKTCLEVSKEHDLGVLSPKSEGRNIEKEKSRSRPLVASEADSGRQLKKGRQFSSQGSKVLNFIYLLSSSGQLVG
jgi:hypothetical protein